MACRGSAGRIRLAPFLSIVSPSRGIFHVDGMANYVTDMLLASRPMVVLDQGFGAVGYLPA